MNFWKAIFAFVFLPLCIGGSSKSSTATTTTYTTSDDRVAAAEGAIVLRDSDVAGGDVLKVSGSGNNITTADPQIVQAAFNYARERDAMAGESLDRVLKAGAETIAQASGKFSERTIIILAAAGAAVLFMFMRRGKA